MAHTDTLLVLWRNRVRQNLDEIADINLEDPKRADLLLTEAITLMECANGLEQALKYEREATAAAPKPTPKKKELTFWDHLSDALTMRPPRY